MNSRLTCFKTQVAQSRYFATYDAVLKLWPISYEESYVTTSYGQTHITSCRAKDASPLALLHGGYASSTMWFPNIADLAENFHVPAIDTIGEPGKNVPTRKNNTKSDLAAWLVSVLDELKIQRTKVVGLSRGGWLADSVTEVVGFEELKEKRASCKMVIAKSNQMQGAHHDNCGAETAGCQAENGREAQEMSVL